MGNCWKHFPPKINFFPLAPQQHREHGVWLYQISSLISFWKRICWDFLILESAETSEGTCPTRWFAQQVIFKTDYLGYTFLGNGSTVLIRFSKLEDWNEPLLGNHKYFGLIFKEMYNFDQETGFLQVVFWCCLNWLPFEDFLGR